jgi:two-component system response regulator MtrA
MSAKILIVDDEPAISESLQAYLQSKGYEVICAQDGPEALAVARESKPDLMILDIMLPKLNGIEVCRILKADSATKDLRVVMVTGRGLAADVELASAAGADDYLVKPFNTDRLLEKIRHVLSGPGPV